MIVKVELDNKEYFSYVFFECIHNYRDKYIVYTDNTIPANLKTLSENSKNICLPKNM